MTARTAGARDDELDRFKNTKALPHRWLRPSTGACRREPRWPLRTSP